MQSKNLNWDACYNTNNSGRTRDSYSLRQYRPDRSAVQIKVTNHVHTVENAKRHFFTISFIFVEV